MREEENTSKQEWEEAIEQEAQVEETWERFNKSDARAAHERNKESGTRNTRRKPGSGKTNRNRNEA